MAPGKDGQSKRIAVSYSDNVDLENAPLITAGRFFLTTICVSGLYDLCRSVRYEVIQQLALGKLNGVV